LTFLKIKLEVSKSLLITSFKIEFFSHGKVATMTLQESHLSKSPSKAVIKVKQSPPETIHVPSAVNKVTLRSALKK